MYNQLLSVQKMKVYVITGLLLFACVALTARASYLSQEALEKKELKGGNFQALASSCTKLNT